jgi:N-acetylmuramoyl-L-alanine amidase CwlA
MNISKCILKYNDCYKANRKIVPKGIVVHSTGANNAFLKRYLAPDDGVIGKNQYKNDWNRSGTGACVHAFIGKDKNGKVRCYQTLPWNMRCWGCGSGKKGSYNDSYIQFEICEDALNDEKYFNEAFNMAIELCKQLMKQYNIPAKNVVSHKEANQKGYATNHGDCDHWLKKFGKDMEWFRKQLTKKEEKKETTNATYIVQVGAYSKKANAEAMQKKLKAAGFDAAIVKK